MEKEVKKKAGRAVRILLVDDSDAIQRLMSSQLKTMGLEVVTVTNGREGVAAALKAQRRGHGFDMIFMDMQMPRMNGYHAVQMLRRKDYKGVIIALTANDMSSDRQQCLDAGCNDYAAKPINKPHLLAMIAHHTQSKTSTDQVSGKLA